MIRWNMAIYAGIGAFVLSFLVGIISGNPFFTILLRAILFGAIFCGLGAAASYLLNRFTPELFNPEEHAQEQDETRENIDIVLPEETPGIGESLIEEGEDSEAALELENAEENREQDREFLSDDVTSSAEDEQPEAEQDEYPDVIREEIPAAAEPESQEQEQEQEPEEPLMTSDTETEMQEDDVATGPHEQPAENLRQGIKDDEIDELPDMGVLENSFLVLKNDDSRESKAFPEVHTRKGKPDIKNQDPQVYAQAVRTIIKRDEEGPKKYGR